MWERLYSFEGNSLNRHLHLPYECVCVCVIFNQSDQQYTDNKKYRNDFILCNSCVQYGRPSATFAVISNSLTLEEHA